jgi:hypothetical protein
MKMNIVTEFSEGRWSALTYDYVVPFYGYGDTEEEAIKDLKMEVEFTVRGGYEDEQEND